MSDSAQPAELAQLVEPSLEHRVLCMSDSAQPAELSQLVEPSLEHRVLCMSDSAQLSIKPTTIESLLLNPTKRLQYYSWFPIYTLALYSAEFTSISFKRSARENTQSTAILFLLSPLQYPCNIKSGLHPKNHKEFRNSCTNWL